MVLGFGTISQLLGASWNPPGKLVLSLVSDLLFYITSVQGLRGTMPLSTRDPFDDNCRHLATFPDHILRDLARNDCAGHDYRKHAVEILLVRKSPLVKHPDLLQFVQELEVELDGIEFDHPDTSSGPGPLTTSVTTQTMFADGSVTVDLDAMRKEGLLADTVLSEEEPIVPTPTPDTVPPKPHKPRKPKDTSADATE